MGTRSLLAYELRDGNIYTQYLQFDGYPGVRGRQYYLGVLEGLRIGTFCTKSGKPTQMFFTRIKHFLNERQYDSGHSIGHHQTVTKEKWFGLKLKWVQEWQYLFTRNGDFIFFANSANRYKVTIPWKFTVAFLKQREPKFRDALDDDAFWSSLAFDGREENEKVLSWGKDAALHVDEDLEYDSSKALFEKILKGETPKILDPVLKLNFGEIMAFPEQGERGWRDYAFLIIETPGEVRKEIPTMFANGTQKRRNQDEASLTYKHLKT